MFNRFIESEMLEALDESPALAITGARQVGKTTLAKHIGSLAGVSSQYIDLEFPADKAKPGSRSVSESISGRVHHHR